MSIKNILFISIGNKVDYQCDCLFHGLNQLPDIQIEILNDYWYMYQGNNPEKLLKQYGKGFTITNRIFLEKRCIQSIEKAKEKIRSHYYDIIIYGSIFRCAQLLEVVLKHYSKNEIVFIDGEDTDFGISYRRRVKGLLKEPIFFRKMKKKALFYSTVGTYFKRELRECDRKYFLPISFAIPEENIVQTLPKKSKKMAFIIPGKMETYIYNNEISYYEGYKEAIFGMTIKKSGWDCLRHYEILANGCIPYFPQLEKCPSTTMVNFPKNIILETNRLYEKNQLSNTLYTYYGQQLLDYTRRFLTTYELANYVISCIQKKLQ